MAVREGLLALLDAGPRVGHQLKTGFEAATGGVWPLNVGQVYTTLDRLERDGLVATTEADGQKTYSITEAGTAELGAWWEAVGGDDPPPRDELMLKVLMALERGPDHALAVVTAQRTALLALLQRRRRDQRARAAAATAGHTDRTTDADPVVAGEALAAVLVDDALVLRAEADLRWLDQCEARVLRARP